MEGAITLETCVGFYWSSIVCNLDLTFPLFTPHHRACMAALVADKIAGSSALDLGLLLKTARSELPSYAVPLFLRMLPEMEVGGSAHCSLIARYLKSAYP